MIKECQVILNNESVSVVKFGNTEVQLPQSLLQNKYCVSAVVGYGCKGIIPL